MSTHAAKSLYTRLLNASPSNMDLCVHALADDNYYQSYDSYPTSTIGTFERMLPQLRTRLAVKASNPGINAVINEAPWPQNEVHLGIGCTVQIVDEAADLAWAANYMQSAAFVRNDPALVLWGENEGAIAVSWDEIISHIQSRHETAIATSAWFAGLSGGVDFLGNNLPPLDEFSSLTTVPGPAPPPSTIAPEAYAGVSPYLPWAPLQSESPDYGGLQLAFDVLGVSSPSSDNSASSFGDFPFTFDFPGFSGNWLAPGNLVGGLGEGEDVASDVSVISSSLSDRGASPVPSVASSEGTTSTTRDLLVPPPATGTSSFRRHSVGQTDAPFGRTGSDKTVTKRGMSEEISVDGNAFNANVDQNQHIPMSDVRASKRIRPFTTATSAPALLSVPLPAVQPPHNDTTDSASLKQENNMSPVSRLPTPVPALPSTSTSASAPGSASASRRTRRRAGGTARPKRTQCTYCSKSFSRLQDAQRHIESSCEASPEKVGIECPECGSILSRVDAAKRHWRSHENPTCETPVWALPG